MAAQRNILACVDKHAPATPAIYKRRPPKDSGTRRLWVILDPASGKLSYLTCRKDGGVRLPYRAMNSVATLQRRGPSNVSAGTQACRRTVGDEREFSPSGSMAAMVIVRADDHMKRSAARRARRTARFLRSIFKQHPAPSRERPQ
jgi:hypothetical protein